MNADKAKDILAAVLLQGKIMVNGAPLSLQELITVQNSIGFLYNAAKEREEDMKPDPPTKQLPVKKDSKPAEAK